MYTKVIFFYTFQSIIFHYVKGCDVSHALKELPFISFKGFHVSHALQASNFLGGENGETVEILLTELFHYFFERLMVIKE